nr:reverse transcriptase domain-containing protein [Tanacetum cinerariifolium]
MEVEEELWNHGFCSRTDRSVRTENVDSILVAKQVNETYTTKEADMIRCLEKRFAYVKHPQANGLVIRANQSLGEGIKARLDDTLFSLTYGTKAVILGEIGMPTLRTAKVDMVRNDEALEINLDLLEEKREHAVIREAKSKAKMEKYYNSKVRSTSFKLGDLVYHRNDASRAKEVGNIGPK